MPANYSKGIYLALLTALISGVAIFVNKFAVDAINPPIVFTALKNTGVGLLIVGLLLAARKWRFIMGLKRKEVVNLILIGIIGGSLPFYLYFSGLPQIPAVNAALIHKSLVFWVAIGAIAFLGERLTKLQLLAVLLLFTSNLFIGGFVGFAFSTGELMVLTATILWAIENVIAKKVLPTVNPDIVVAFRMGLGSLILLVAAFITSPAALINITDLTQTQWLWMALTITILLAYVMSWYRALKYAPAITVTSVLVASTLVTNLLSAVFVTHVWTIEMAIQALLIMAGLAIFYLPAKKKFFSNLSLSFAKNITS